MVVNGEPSKGVCRIFEGRGPTWHRIKDNTLPNTITNTNTFFVIIVLDVLHSCINKTYTVLNHRC